MNRKISKKIYLGGYFKRKWYFYYLCATVLSTLMKRPIDVTITLVCNLQYFYFKDSLAVKAVRKLHRLVIDNLPFFAGTYLKSCRVVKPIKIFTM